MAFETVSLTARLIGIPGSAITVWGAIYSLRQRSKNHSPDKDHLELIAPLLRQDLIIGLPTWNVDVSAPNYAVTRDDGLAQIKIAEAVRRQDISCEVKSANHFSDADHRRPSMQICGPARNPVTARLFDIRRPAYRLECDANRRYSIVDRYGKIAHPAPERSRDFGIIAKLRNPRSSDSDNFIFAAAGIHGLGTLGATQLLTDQPDEILRKLPNGTARKFTSFVGVVESIGDENGLPQSSNLIAFATE